MYILLGSNFFKSSTNFEYSEKQVCTTRLLGPLITWRIAPYEIKILSNFDKKFEVMKERWKFSAKLIPDPVYRRYFWFPLNGFRKIRINGGFSISINLVRSLIKSSTLLKSTKIWYSTKPFFP